MMAIRKHVPFGQVEVVQIISGKGMFDLVDLNLYLIGYFCGYLLYERLLRSGINA